MGAEVGVICALRRAGACALRRAGGYFSCLAKKSNQKKASPRSRRLRRSLALLGRAGGENGLKHVFADYPGPPCAAQRLRGRYMQGRAPRLICGGLPFNAFEGAEQRRRGGGLRRKSALALFRRPPRRAAQGSRAATAFVGSPFFGYFLWRSKESNRPRGGERRPPRGGERRPPRGGERKPPRGAERNASRGAERTQPFPC